MPINIIAEVICNTCGNGFTIGEEDVSRESMSRIWDTAEKAVPKGGGSLSLIVGSNKAIIMCQRCKDDHDKSAAVADEAEQLKDGGDGTWWCTAHDREATYPYGPGKKCDPDLGGITLPCIVEFREKDDDQFHDD